MPEGIIITKVDRVPDSCFDCEMHDDVDWCPFAGECVGIYARIKKMNPRCPIIVDEQEISDGKQDI